MVCCTSAKRASAYLVSFRRNLTKSRIRETLPAVGVKEVASLDEKVFGMVWDWGF
jgi:hypothetical protein